ncbi:sn-glycerol-3-phosphate import ATP-binding protein UgpC [uncultured Ruminococcus sp.]|uniref:ABC transporter ATP-binding protein n=1 Tax=Massiliimalia timonensis TaxID=1987501 RepID=A0A8J6P139_9FIRM|nr:ABC transporter ATP-binding protein [Massiliimalia timonensis]MBC8610744.1 ABC transporter ATP-binding protein [Massiliimalia timonensis]MBS7174903.1 ABC transporter ATP-binding protein [Clostridiales bacterium]SCH95135.1 sn-glycerol-3-phosphate import ATP-binding protein UgpC [uncultured Clostridium sp.]SCI28050.1 sn-glycerol-3-phosphate import ATP-binding protein UgpC [uncultured Ruminococcus sp.]
MSRIILQDIKKSFKKTAVLHGIDLEIQDGSFTVLLGPSGCGKSTLLRIIAGLEKQDAGRLIIGNEDVSGLEPQDRDIAMVFQNYALYPHMNVRKNIEYGLKAKRVPKEERQQRIDSVVKLVQLEDQLDKLPAQMSGGQRQRVALARAIVKRPRAFLMDEPLSNLDAKLRSQMRVEIASLHKHLGTTFLYVTHDQVEAMSMGTHIVVLNGGSIMQQGTPREIYTNPQNLFVAQFIGSPPANVLKFGDHYAAIRPEEIYFQPDVGRRLTLKGEVQAREHLGGETLYYVMTEYGRMVVKGDHFWDDDSQTVQMYFSEQSVMFFDQQENRTEVQPDILALFSHNAQEAVS